jgi:hypothetical protein
VNCVGFIYDRENHNYLITRVVKDYIEPGNRLTSALDSERLDINGVIVAIQRRLSALDSGELQTLVSDMVTQEARMSIIGYIFHDVFRNPYIQFRFADLVDEKVKYRFSQFAGRPRLLRRIDGDGRSTR